MPTDQSFTATGQAGPAQPATGQPATGQPAVAARPGAASRHSHGYTDFAAYSHQQLYDMLFASDPASLREAAAAWLSTGRMLTDQAQQLKHRLTGFTQMWQGAAADQYRVMITDLAGGLDRVGSNALAMNNLMAQSAEAVDKARAAMPPPQQVPDLDPQVLAAATAAPPPDLASVPGAQAQFAADQQGAQQAVQAHQQQLATAQSAHAQAVQVMQTLSQEYSGTEDSIPSAPESVATTGTGETVQDASAVPLPGDGLTGVPTLTGAGAGAGGLTGDPALLVAAAGHTAGSASIPDSPLFGHMFTSGLVAASAAATGRFGSVMPKLPSFLNPLKKKASDSASSAASAAEARAAAAAQAHGNAAHSAEARAAAAVAARSAALRMTGAGGGAFAGLGGGGGGIGGIGGGAGGPSAAAYPSLIDGSASGSAVAGVSAATGQLAGAAAGAPGTPGASMPMMPMGGMAGAGGMDAGGRRIPPWLVETEDVWGESAAVTPPVIGEDG